MSKDCLHLFKSKSSRSYLLQYVTLQNMWPDVALPYLKIIPNSVLLSPEINNQASISAALSSYVPRAMKDRDLQSRREENDARALAVKETKESRSQMWNKRVEDDAIRCGLKPYVLCSTPGCIRQLTCRARMD